MRILTVLAALSLVSMAGCGGRQSRIAHEKADMVAQDTRRVTRIPDRASPEMARAAMGRKPDAVRYVGKQEIHYYLIEGAAEGEALRLVFEGGELIGRSIVKTRSE